MFDADQHIALGIAARRGRAIERDLYAIARIGVINRIGAAAAIEHIGAGATDQRVIATAAMQRIIACPSGDQIVARTAIKLHTGVRTGQRVVVIGPGHPFDVGQRIALRIAAMAGAVGQVDIDRRARGAVVGLVKAAAAIEHIGAGPAGQHIIAGTAKQRIIACAARQRVVASAARQAVIARAAAQVVGIG